VIATKDCKSIVKTETKKMEETKANFIKMKGQCENFSNLGLEFKTLEREKRRMKYRKLIDTGIYL
jgi:hypothetical protein